MSGDVTALSPGSMAPTVHAPSGPLGLLLRALVALGLLVGWVQLAHTPVHRPIEELVRALETGQVTSVTIQRPAADSSGGFPVEWDEPGRRPSYSTYLHNTDSVSFSWDTSGVDSFGDGSTPRVDEGAEIIAMAERAGVPVVERGWEPTPGGLHWNLSGIAWLAGLFLLVGGPQIRLATRWGWFWLAAIVPPAMLAFVVLEPTPWGRRGALPGAARRLTGGWAILLGLVLAALLSAVPWYSELFPN